MASKAGHSTHIALCIVALLAASATVQPAYGARLGGFWNFLGNAFTGIEGALLDRTSASSGGVTSASGFPPTARVGINLTGPDTKLLRDLRVGDKVVVYDPVTEELQLEEVLSNDLQTFDTPVELLTLHVAHYGPLSYSPKALSSYKVTLTPSHWVFSEGSPEIICSLYVDGGPKFPWAADLRPAGNLKTGNILWTPAWDSTKSAPLEDRVKLSRVTHTERTSERGLFNLQTASGSVLVDGILATTYSVNSTLPAHLDALLFGDLNRYWPAGSEEYLAP